MDEYQKGYKEGYAAGQKNTARKMASAAFKIETQLRDTIGMLQNTIDYLKTCVSCAEYDCQRKRCLLKREKCKNLNHWRMPE